MTAPRAVRNIEVKARAPRGVAALRLLLPGLGGVHQWTRRQVDTFFTTPRGRLKLRQEYEGGRLLNAELIPYLRADTAEVRESSFAVLPVALPDLVAGLFAEILGVRSVVEKTRELWVVHEGTVRVHLDEVAGLGAFCEIEAIVETEAGLTVPGEDPTTVAALQEQRTHDLLAALGLGPEDIQSQAYADLLENP